MHSFLRYLFWFGVTAPVMTLANAALAKTESSDQVKWGLKVRAGGYEASHFIDSPHLSLNDSDNSSQSEIPVMLAFSPTNRSFYFSQWFFDYETPFETQNMNPTYIDRSWLYSNYLNSTEQSTANSNSDWVISADFKTWAVVAGYQFGVFLPLSPTMRILKTAAGLTTGWYDYDIVFNQCSSYNVSAKKLTSSSKQEGDCANKFHMGELKYSAPGLGATVSLLLYEWYENNWLVNVGYLEAGSITTFNKQTVPNRSSSLQLQITSSFLTIELFNLAYFF